VERFRREAYIVIFLHIVQNPFAKRESHGTKNLKYNSNGRAKNCVLG
jgi:hypothetical protein